MPLTGPAHAGSAPVVMIIRLAGEVDDLLVPELRSRLASAAGTPPRTFVVIDLSAVTFMNCAGLGPLLEAQALLGQRLWLRHPTRPVRRLLALIGPLAEFTVVDDATFLPGESGGQPGAAVTDEWSVNRRSTSRSGTGNRPFRFSRPDRDPWGGAGCAALRPSARSSIARSRGQWHAGMAGN